MFPTSHWLRRLLLASCMLGAPLAQAQDADPSTYATQRFAPHAITLPSSGGCACDIARFQTIMDNDYRTGNVGQSVYAQIEKELETASRACSAGQDAQARAMVRSSRSRHGYPAG